MKRLLSLLLISCLLFSAAFVSAEILSDTEKEEKLNAAVEIVATYLESPNADISLTPAIELLEEIGNYNAAQYMSSYTKILQMLEDDNYTFMLGFYMDTIQNKQFADFLADLIKERPVFASLDVLTNYRFGREAEKNGDMETASMCYAKCGGFFDCLKRIKGMYGGIYDRAMDAMKNGNYAEAYKLFEKRNGFEDSKINMEHIVALLGYDPSHEHTWAPATCAQPKHCTVCGATEGGTLPHTWAPATCTQPRFCTVCGATEGSPLPHTWTPATCTQPKHCTVCGATEGSPASHSWREATCTEPKTCTVCGAVEGSPAPHTWKAATCTEPKTCIVCGATEGGTAPHTWMEATCTKPKTCAVCGTTEGYPNGHQWTEATCTEPSICMVCGAIGDTLADHEWLPATCTEPETCAVCGLTAGEPLGHQWAPATYTEPETCTACGLTRGEPAPTPVPVRIGDTVTFGHYEQDNNRSNGKEPIEWLVLEVNGSKAFLVSKYALDCRRYEKDWIGTTWEECGLRKWLNNDFMNAAFSSEERKSILSTKVDNSKNQGFRGFTEFSGNDTVDQMFLLSYAEAWFYFISDQARLCMPTKYAIAQGATYMNSTSTTIWWLRSPGSHRYEAARVGRGGARSEARVDSPDVAVRPAMWVDVEKTAIKATPSPKPTATPTPQPTKTPTPRPAALTEVEIGMVVPGDVVKYGHYEQDNDRTDGAEPIEWVVLDVKENKALLLSKYALDCKRYDTHWNSTTWAECSLRTWLNKDFLDSAFSAEEKKYIQTTNVDNSKSQGYRAYDERSGSNTRDKLFVLSYAETWFYFSTDDSRKCFPTEYAVSHGAANVNNGPTSWWLRSPGTDKSYAVRIVRSGARGDCRVDTSDVCVRPAMWVDLGESSGYTPPPTQDEILAAAKLGDIVKFGQYEQDNDFNNGKEPIEWYVVDAEDDKVLLVSRYALDVKRYNERKSFTTTWEWCTLRNWLNNDFLNAAFSSKEQKWILKTTVTAEKNSQYSKVKTGEDTEDKVFLLSESEAGRYFIYDTQRTCYATQYAMEIGRLELYSNTRFNVDGIATWWWLRTPGHAQDSAVVVHPNGSVVLTGKEINADTCVIRPALWVDQSAIN